METKNIRSKIANAGWMRTWFALVAVMTLGVGCASYQGTATSAQPSVVTQQGQWTMVPNFPRVIQANGDDCGAAALSAVLGFWGHTASPQTIETSLGRSDSRLQAGDMEAYAHSVGLQSHVFFGTMKDIVHELEKGRPVIVGLGKMFEDKKAMSHYEVVVGYEPTKKQLLLLDPASGWKVDSLEGFAKEWAISKGVTMVAFPASSDTNPGAVAAETATATAPTLATLPNGPALGTRAEAQSYAAREATSPDAKKYRGGDVIVISASALAVILLVVLILILI